MKKPLIGWRDGGDCLFRWPAIGMLLLVFLSTGALGFKSMDDCTNSNPPKTGADLAICLHEAALTYASMAGTPPDAGLEAKAVAACDAIQSIPISIKEGQANLCYADIALYMQKDDICSKIKVQRISNWLSGEETSQEQCKAKIAKIIQAQNYQCAILFIPFLLLAAGAVICSSRRNP